MTALIPLSRPFGTAPVDPVAGAQSLAAAQAEVVTASRFGIPAQVHEECLNGLSVWRATVYPAPLSWDAAFDPELVEQMARHIAGYSASRGGCNLAPVEMGRRHLSDVVLPPFEMQPATRISLIPSSARPDPEPPR